jgi:ribosomal-protein-alanine N-acetyltransferase
MKSKPTAAVHIRLMSHRDLREVYRIERQCFPLPWSGADFSRCFQTQFTNAIVAEVDERVAGFVVYELRGDKITVLNLAVAPDDQRAGIGTALMGQLINRLGVSLVRITLEVRETNLAAQLFFKSLGFRAVLVLRDFYEEVTEDAYLMQYRADAPFCVLVP